MTFETPEQIANGRSGTRQNPAVDRTSRRAASDPRAGARRRNGKIELDPRTLEIFQAQLEYASADDGSKYALAAKRRLRNVLSRFTAEQKRTAAIVAAAVVNMCEKPAKP